MMFPLDAGRPAGEFVSASGIDGAHDESRGVAAGERGGRSCCEGAMCTRADIARLLTPDSPIEQRVISLASATAFSCPGLSADDLRTCFSRAFELTPECQLFALFANAYRAECRSQGGNASFTASGR